MATTAATIIGMVQGFALLRRIKSMAQWLVGGSTRKPIDLDAVRRHLS
jgi:hypothetical protein